VRRRLFHNFRPPPVFRPFSFRPSLLNIFGIAGEETAEKIVSSPCGERAENLWKPSGEAVETPVEKLCESGG
jgi:hypothetical protein